MKAIRRYNTNAPDRAELLDAIVDAAAVPVIVMDLDGTVVIWNKAAEQMFGWPADQVIGHRHPGIPPEGDPQRAELLRAVRGGSKRIVETRRLTRDGREIEAVLAVTGVRVRGGDVGLTVGILHDLTDLRALQQRAQAAEERWKILLDNIAEFAVLFVEADGTVVDANRAAGALLEPGNRDVLGRNIAEFCTGSAEHTAKLLERARQDGRATLESWARRLDGTQFWADIVIATTRSRDASGYAVVLRDVSARKAEQDRERRRLQQSAAITAFAQRAAREQTAEAVREAAVEHLAAAMQVAYSELVVRSGAAGATVRHAFGWSERVPSGADVRLESSIYAEAIAQSEPVLRRLSERDYDDAPHLRELGLTWGSVVALRVEDEVWTLGGFSSTPLAETDVYPLQAIATLCEAVTARRRAERHLAERERTLRVALEQMPAVFWTVDRDFRFTTAQGAGMRVHGNDPRDLIGTSMFNFASPGGPAHRAIEKAFEGESGFFQGEYGGRAYDNHVEPLRDANGRVEGAMNLAFDVTERRRDEEALRASREELRRLSARKTRVQEDERRRIAHELHDELGQRLTALRMEASLLPRKLGEACTSEATSAIGAMIALIDDTITTVRRVATDLRPVVLDHFGLRTALEYELAMFKTRSGIDYKFAITPGDLRVADHLATALYRIVQESLTNVVRHANATSVRVSLEEQHGTLLLQVADNGRGITDAELASSGSLGLVGVRERARQEGGDAEVRRAPGGGTVVSVRLPKGETS